MGLKFNGEHSDIRGKILFSLYGNKKINLFEIKKGYARGGHYHNYEVNHTLVSGKIEYRETNIETEEEKISIITAPSSFYLMPKCADLIIALEDSIFTEVFDGEYESKVFQPYRKIVQDLMGA